MRKGWATKQLVRADEEASAVQGVLGLVIFQAYQEGLVWDFAAVQATGSLTC